MKILIINDLYNYGGTEVQIFREQKILQNDKDDVMIFTMDNTLETGYRTNSHFNVKVNRSNICKAINRFIINLKIFSYLKYFLSKYNPDVIHLNNINYSPFTILLCCKKYKCFQTIRDYSSICPKGICIKNDLTVCKGYKVENCQKCVKSNIYLKIRLWNLKLFNRERKKIIKQFICPSQELTNCCNNNNLNTVCINNPFDFSIIDNINVKTNTEKVFLYYGQLKKEKGVDRFIEAFHNANLNDAKLLLCGKLEKNLKNYINGLNYDNIEYIGRKDYVEMLNIVASVDFVVVPSLWLENYPNTVLEGMVLSKVILASDRGGMISMINNDNLIFNVLNQEDIISKIKYAYNLSKKEYNLIINNNQKYLMTHNLEDIFHKKLYELFIN